MIVYCFKLRRSRMSWFFCQPGFPKSSHKVAHKSQRSNSKFVKDRWNVSHDSLVHVCSLSASLSGKKKHFLGIIILIFFAWALSHYRETDWVLCDIEISGKIQNYFLKSDSILLNFALQIQHSWALGLIPLR